jgi:hypothetical protein
VVGGQKPSRIDLEAGGSLLETWQGQWEDLHLNAERNAKAASRCDKKITTIKFRTQKQWNDVATLQILAAKLPKINANIQEIMNTLGNTKDNQH